MRGEEGEKVEIPMKQGVVQGRVQRSVQHVLVPILLFCGIAGLAVAQPVAPQSVAAGIAAVAQRIRHAIPMPGLSVAAVANGSIIVSEGFGTLDAQGTTPATGDSRYRLASVSKALTAVAVMRLVEQGRVALDSPIQQYCPEYPFRRYVITVRHLLAHCSGIRHYADLAENYNRRYFPSLAESVGIVANDSLLFPPGTQFHYSTYAFNLLGRLVERVCGQPFQQAIQTLVLNPAGMLRSGSIGQLRQLGVEQIADGYTRTLAGEILPSKPLNLSDRLPGAGLVSTANDLAQFALALLQHRLLADTTLRQMWANATFSGVAMPCGLGWFVAQSSLGPLAMHDGAQSGCRALLMILPERHIAVALLANMEGDDLTEAMQQGGMEILGILSNAQNPPPTR